MVLSLTNWQRRGKGRANSTPGENVGEGKKEGEAVFFMGRQCKRRGVQID